MWSVEIKDRKTDFEEGLKIEKTPRPLATNQAILPSTFGFRKKNYPISTATKCWLAY